MRILLLACIYSPSSTAAWDQLFLKMKKHEIYPSQYQYGRNTHDHKEYFYHTAKLLEPDQKHGQVNQEMKRIVLNRYLAQIWRNDQEEKNVSTTINYISTEKYLIGKNELISVPITAERWRRTLSIPGETTSTKE